MWRLIIGLLLLGSTTAARAEWFEASSPNFVIYADGSESNIRRFSQELERYHSALAFLMKANLAAPSPSNRVTVYVVDSLADVRRLSGGNDKQVAGFYIPRAGGSVAIIPHVSAGGGNQIVDFSMATLLHEYAHHFMYQASNFPMPRWYAEGGAEFFMAASFPSDGGVWVGRPNVHRAAELVWGREVTVSNLLDPATYKPRNSSWGDEYYGKAWALFHYLTFDNDRRAQLERYLRELAAGKTSRQAADLAFGDLDQLGRDLDKYLRKPNLMVFTLSAQRIKPGETRLRSLSAGEVALMPIVVQSKRGVDAEQAAQLLVRARAIAARFPGDASVQTGLAEAEHDAGNQNEALAAANAALAIDRTRTEAFVQKGYALFAIAEKSGQPADYARARGAFVALNRLENDHPIPLIYFYRTYRAISVTPPKVAIDGIERAAQLAPFDLGLRLEVAQQQIKDGRTDLAAYHLRAVIGSPHDWPGAQLARELLSQIGGASDGASQPAPAAGSNAK